MLLNICYKVCVSCTLIIFYQSVFLCVLMSVFIKEAEANQNSTIFPAVFVFGDSIVDTGNNNYIRTLIRVNYRPYGKDFFGGLPTGRFCDGKVPADLFAEELGIKQLLPPYLDPTLTLEDFITGVNFASGGAGYDPLTSQFVSVLSLSDQLVLFEEYILKLEALVGEEKAKKIISNSLYILIAGANDISNTYFGTPIRRAHYDYPSYATFLINFASNFLQDSYKLGARKIGVLNVPPIGCVPAIRTVKGGAERKCVDKYNYMAQLINSKLEDELNSLNTKLSGSKMVYMDEYTILLDMIYYPTKYGFSIGNKGCCGTGTVEVAYLCKFACPNVNDYVFWDSYHPTEKAYRILVHEILEMYMKILIE